PRARPLLPPLRRRLLHRLGRPGLHPRLELPPHRPSRRLRHRPQARRRPDPLPHRARPPAARLPDAGLRPRRPRRLRLGPPPRDERRRAAGAAVPHRPDHHGV
ncbi:hypothetical protein BN1708_020098, partial [Verticillium longisporum]